MGICAHYAMCPTNAALSITHILLSMGMVDFLRDFILKEEDDKLRACAVFALQAQIPSMRYGQEHERKSLQILFHLMWGEDWPDQDNTKDDDNDNIDEGNDDKENKGEQPLSAVKEKAKEDIAKMVPLGCLTKMAVGAVELFYSSMCKHTYRFVRIRESALPFVSASAARSPQHYYTPFGRYHRT